MKNFIISLLVFFAVPGICLAVDSWPAGSGTVIATLSDASGVVWHEGRQSLFVVQNTGTLNELDSNGNLKNQWNVAGDLEGITLAEDSRYLYIGIEHPDSILEFDLQTEALTGKSWDLTTWMTGPDNSGLEGLAYRNGYFLGGLQNDGKIYVFNVNLSVSGNVDYVETITPFEGYTDIAGLEYNTRTGITYSIFDANNALIELNASNVIVNHYSLPGSAQEGFVVVPNCLLRVADVYIVNDDNGQIIKYNDFPITCLDADSDGVSNTSDCNDYDAAISINRAYYRDADGDGRGDQYTTTAVCDLSAPSGYVTDNTDPVDLVSNGDSMYINGTERSFFPVSPTSVQFTDNDYYADGYREVIAVGLIGKRAYITTARVQGNNVSVIKRVAIKKKFRSVQIINQDKKRKFVTKFNGKKKYIWKIKTSGSFSRSH